MTRKQTDEAKTRAAVRKAAKESEKDVDVKAAPEMPVITQEDAHNTLLLLNRVSTTGMQEAALLVTLGQKFHAIKGAYEVPKDG